MTDSGSNIITKNDDNRNAICESKEVNYERCRKDFDLV